MSLLSPTNAVIKQRRQALNITAGTLVPAVLMATSHSYGNGQI